MTREHLSSEDRRAATVGAVIALAANHDPGEISTTAIAKHMGAWSDASFPYASEAFLTAASLCVGHSTLTPPAVHRFSFSAATAEDPAEKTMARPATATRDTFSCSEFI